MTSSSFLYRKYRSQTFDELVGQEPVVRTLKNAIASDRISHAYLFTGPRGVGKTSAARLLARAANCTSTDLEKPCNQCPNCLAGALETVTDLIEIDAASNTGVDNIRDVIERANFVPSVWTTKFYIIDEVHMLSVSAFNALLKTLEEPPPNTAFILATTEVHKVPATVASRCQRFDFRRIPLSAMVERLEHICKQESIEADRPALELVAREATGSLRDALSLLDKLRVYSDSGITLEAVQEVLGTTGSEQVAGFVDSLVAADLATGLRQVNSVIDEGLDLRQFNRQVVEHLRALLLVKSGAAANSDMLLDVTADAAARLRSQAEQVTVPDLLKWISAFAKADAEVRSTPFKQLPLELALVKATLKDEQTSPAPTQNRAAELQAATEHVGAIPEPGNSRKAKAESKDLPVPPPIHMELGALGNGTQPAPPPNQRIEDEIQAEPDSVEDFNEAAMSPPQNTQLRTGDELERLLQLWPQIIEQINARSKQMAAAFRNSSQIRPVSLKDQVCTVGFRDPFHVKRTQTALYREIIETSLARVLGYPCRLESVTFKDAGIAPESGADAQPENSNGHGGNREKPSPYETTRGRAAINIFGIDKFEDQ